MGFPVPKISYNPGTGSIDLNFTWPPVQKSGTNDLEATRQDSTTISGLRQSIYEHTDEFLPLQLDFVPQVDLPAWSDFMKFALKGGLFNYYPDKTLAHFTTYTLDDTKWTVKRNFIGMAKFSLRLRKAVGSDQTGS
jgi:hypothetical protein